MSTSMGPPSTISRAADRPRRTPCSWRCGGRRSSRDTKRPLSPCERGAAGEHSFENQAACWIALNLQGFGPTGRANVQYSSNFTGSVRLPSTT